MPWGAPLWICGLGMTKLLLQIWRRTVFVLLCLRVEKEYCEISAFRNPRTLKVTYLNSGLRSGTSKRDKYFSRNATQLNVHCSSQFLDTALKPKLESHLYDRYIIVLCNYRGQKCYCSNKMILKYFPKISRKLGHQTKPELVTLSAPQVKPIMNSYSSKGSNEYMSLNFIYLTSRSMIWFWWWSICGSESVRGKISLLNWEKLQERFISNHDSSAGRK